MDNIFTITAQRVGDRQFIAYSNGTTYEWIDGKWVRSAVVCVCNETAAS